MRYVVVASDAAPVLSIDQMGYSEDPAVTRWGPGKRELYIIHYVISGAGYFRGRRVTAGEGFVITPGMHEVYGPDAKEPWSFLWLISADPRMASMLCYLHVDQDTGIFQYSFIPHMRMLAGRLQADAGRMISGVAMLELLLGILRRHEGTSGGGTKSSAAQRYVDFAIRYLDGNYHQPVSVEELTDLLGVSQPYLYRVFRQATGVSPRQYLTQCRLRQAKQLLSETTMPVVQVALSVGFDNPLTFTRFFTAHEGISPTGYRSGIESALSNSATD